MIARLTDELKKVRRLIVRFEERRTDFNRLLRPSCGYMCVRVCVWHVCQRGDTLTRSGGLGVVGPARLVTLVLAHTELVLKRETRTMMMTGYTREQTYDAH